jgi:hypothetical protein
LFEEAWKMGMDVRSCNAPLFYIGLPDPREYIT